MGKLNERKCVRCKRIKQSCESLCQKIVVHALYYNDGCEQLHLFILCGSFQNGRLDTTLPFVNDRHHDTKDLFGVATLINKHVQIENICKEKMFINYHLIHDKWKKKKRYAETYHLNTMHIDYFQRQ